MGEYPTAKELMESGRWRYRKSFNIALYQINYYVDRSDNETYHIYRIIGVNFKGEVVARLLLGVMIPLKWLLNSIRKRMGEEVLGDLIEETNEVLLARRHMLDIGCSVKVSDHIKPTNEDECDVLINKDIERLRGMNNA
ncbi:hypothetical protein FDG96_gp67 [Bacillus phage Mgbh1]|uniref:Uncharacterized protein n=1 Tax=Bacillus phage Mgbh1 TaxID=1796993 RepID=A0A142F1R9_9CAUD|nr:hypothetical protein FDG96_gp67 [Bacillus phage Mgbh1]AMQ66726.1 hypothetical protein [Bacillus phage Mgbh1]